MSKSKAGSSKKKSSQEVKDLKAPWIKPRSGLIVIAVVSVLLAGYMFWQLLPSAGFVDSLLWGLGAGASIWAIFGFSYLFNKLVRRT